MDQLSSERPSFLWFNAMMQYTVNLTHHFLIAMPDLTDPDFHRTVAYVCMHNEDGAIGIIINRPLETHLGELLKQLDIDTQIPEIHQTQIFHGGDIETKYGFILHSPAQTWDSSVFISKDIAITTSKDVLEMIATGKGPQKSLIALGYAGWGAGQLEQEIKDNLWLSTPAKLQIMFDEPAEKRWQLATEYMGVEHISNLSLEIGNA